MKEEYDVVIIGAGPNGLEAGAYLSKTGAKVLILEKRYEIGGGLATDEFLLPGYLFNTHAIYMMMTDYAPIYQDFDFKKYRCEHIYPPVQVSLPLTDGRSLCLCRDLDKTCESIAQFSQKDAEAYRSFYQLCKTCVDDFIAPATYVPAVPPLEQVVTLQASEVGRTVMEYSEMSPKSIIEKHFESDTVKGLLLYLICMWGLDYDLEGMGYLALLYFNRATNYALCKGGSHTIASALAKIIHENGGEALDSKRIKRIIVENGEAKGVEMEDGRIINAKAVLSTIDPHQTFFKLVGEKHLEEEFAMKLKGWHWEKFSLMTTHLCLEEVPQFKGSATNPDINNALLIVLGTESEEKVINDFDTLYRGEIPEDAVVHCSFPSIHDPTQAPQGRCSGLITCLAPYNLKEGKDKWYDINFQKKQEKDRLAILQRYAPNIDSERVLQSRLFTPRGIEDKFSDMVGGSFKQGQYHPLQMGYNRPNDDCSHHQTPIKNLYLGGSSTYPGGCVIWGSGYLAAGRVADDLGLNRWWPESEIITRAKKKGTL